MDRRLLVSALGMFALGTDSYVVAGVFPEISRFFAVPISAAGQMTTIYAVTYALLAPTIAALAAGVPRKTLLRSSLALFTLANLATAAPPPFRSRWRHRLSPESAPRCSRPRPQGQRP
jgi:predicted MFS family arabinose efflux permease